MKNQYRHELLNQIKEARIQKYIKENFESFDKFEEKISEALGCQYEAIYDFFYGIITADYDYKILMARRCLVLCQIFTHIFSVREPDMESRGILIGDRAVARYLPDFADKKVLILDDILIHGRSVRHVYKFIAEYNKNIAKLDIRVYMMSHNVKCIEKELLDKIHPAESGYEQEWKTLSNKIVNAIYISNIPYTSFVGAYSVYDLEKDFTGGCTNFQCINNTNDWQQMQECESAVYFCNNEEPEFFHICSYINCIRIYKSKILGKMTLIPYSFTKAIKADGIERFYQHIADCLPTKLQHVKDEFLLMSTQTELWEYKSRLFNALVSCMYGIHFFQGKVNIQDFMYDFDTMVKSYGEEIAMEFMNLEYSDIETFLNMPW